MNRVTYLMLSISFHPLTTTTLKDMTKDYDTVWEYVGSFFHYYFCTNSRTGLNSGAFASRFTAGNHLLNINNRQSLSPLSHLNPSMDRSGTGSLSQKRVVFLAYNLPAAPNPARSLEQYSGSSQQQQKG